VRIVHLFGKDTEVGVDSHIVARVLKPVLEEEARKRFANGGVIWSPNQTVWHVMEQHLHNPASQTLSADIKQAFWNVRQNSVYRLLRSVGLGQHMAALISRQMCDVVEGLKGRRLLMGHPLSPATLALWIATVARKQMRFLHLIGATVTWYVDNVTISWRHRWVGGKALKKALQEGPPGVFPGKRNTGPPEIPTPTGEGSLIPERGITPYPGMKTPIPEGGMKPALEITPALLMRVFAPTPIKWKKNPKSGRAWSSWTGRELGLVRVKRGSRAIAQQHRKREGRKQALRTYLRARAMLKHPSPVVRQTMLRQMAVAIGRLSWYSMVSPLSRLDLKLRRHHSANRVGATLEPGHDRAAG
jgi:hypothetical protein